MLPEFHYLDNLIRYHLNSYFPSDDEVITLPEPEPGNWHLPLKDFVLKNNLDHNEALLLLISLTPHLYPDLFDNSIQSKITGSGDFPKIGGVRGKNSRAFIPTGETALFLLAGEDIEKRFLAQNLFGPDHLFSKQRILWLEELPAGEPAMSGKIILAPEYIELFSTGKIGRPHFNSSFPANLIQTSLTWNDLVLSDEVMKQIKELEQWLQHNKILMGDWGMADRLKRGYRVLFHGPPGTGKTLTASLLGKYTKRDVYKIDLSMVVSKYIGETEKNLENLFAKAEAKNWILFFDEADAIFGKRTGIRDAHDKYANQEVSYLLQRIEDYDGLVILATNFKSNIDDAFSRRFQSHIYFPLPKFSERLALWQKSFPEKIVFEKPVDLTSIARQYELTGAHIMNIVQYSCLQTLARNENTIRNIDILDGIRKEYSKEGKLI